MVIHCFIFEMSIIPTMFDWCRNCNILYCPSSRFNDKDIFCENILLDGERNEIITQSTSIIRSLYISVSWGFQSLTPSKNNNLSGK